MQAGYLILLTAEVGETLAFYANTLISQESRTSVKILFFYFDMKNIITGHKFSQIPHSFGGL